jgi:hypothetical protein
MYCSRASGLLYLPGVMRLSFQEVKLSLKSLSFLPVTLLLATLALAALPSVLQAKEETLVILTTTDTRSEIAPCG